MLEKAFTGLGITGLSRDVSWGLYIGQFTFLVGVAAVGTARIEADCPIRDNKSSTWKY